MGAKIPANKVDGPQTHNHNKFGILGKEAVFESVEMLSGGGSVARRSWDFGRFRGSWQISFRSARNFGIRDLLV